MSISLSRRAALQALCATAVVTAAGTLAACGAKASVTGAAASRTAAAATTAKAGSAVAATPTVDPAAAIKAAKTPLTVTGNPTSTSDQARMNLWNKEHANEQVTIIQLSLGQGVEAESKYIALLAGGTPPSVVKFDRFQVATYAIRGAFRPLDDLIAREKYDMSRFVKACADEGKGMDGKQYALPTSTDDRMLFYNKDLFQQAGLDPDKPPQDWATLQDYATRLNKAAGGKVQQLGAGVPFDGLYLWGWSGGGHWLKTDAAGKVDNWHVDMVNAGNVDALTFLYGLLQAQDGQRPFDWAEKHGGGNGGIENSAWGTIPKGQDEFSSGKVAMEIKGNWTLGSIAKTYSQTKVSFGVTSVPRKDASMGPLTWSGGWSYIISRGVKAPEAAFQLATAYISESYVLAGAVADEAYQKQTNPGAIYFPGSTAQPAIDTVLHTKYKANIPEVDAAWDASQQLMQHTRFRPQSAAAAEMWDANRRAYDQALSGTSPEQALAEVQKTLQAVLDQRAQDLKK